MDKNMSNLQKKKSEYIARNQDIVIKSQAAC